MAAVDGDAIDPSLDSSLGLQTVTTTGTGHVMISQGLPSAQRTTPWDAAEIRLGVSPRSVRVDFNGILYATRYDSNDELNLGLL